MDLGVDLAAGLAADLETVFAEAEAVFFLATGFFADVFLAAEALVGEALPEAALAVGALAGEDFAVEALAAEALVVVVFAADAVAVDVFAGVAPRTCRVCPAISFVPRMPFMACNRAVVRP